MPAAKTAPTPAEAFLVPLAACLARNPDLEGLVFWESGGWPAAPSEMLENEEITFYAEGLMIEGFGVEWQVLALPDAPTLPGHIRLLVWETGAEPPPGPGTGWHVIQRQTWNARAA